MKVTILFLFIIALARVLGQQTTGATEVVSTTTEVAQTTAIATAAETSLIVTTETRNSAVTTTSSATTTSPSMVDTGSCLTADPFSTHDYFPNKLDLNKLDSTSQFNVTYSNTYKLVHNKMVDEYYVLYCTKSAPDLGSTFQAKTFIQVPVKSFAAVDTRAIGYLNLLEQGNNIAFVGNISNYTSPCATNTPTYFNLSDPNLDRTRYDLAIYPATVANDPKGVALGMGYATTPLGNAQWIKYFALFTNQETLADTVYDRISTNYNIYRDSINAADHISYKRNITFMNYDPLSTRFNVMQDQYFKNLTSDAGAVLLTPLVSQPLDPSVMKGQLQNSSLVVDLTPESAFNETYGHWQNWLGYSDTSSAEQSALEAYQHSKKYINNMDAPPFVRYKQLWRLDLISNQGALDYWTRGFARPDLMLQDLIQAQFPDFFNSRSRTFMRAFANDESSRTTSSDGYECNLDQWEKAKIVSYRNTATDAPVLDAPTNTLPLAAVIGISVAGGMVALSCLATCIVLLIRKYKNRSNQFTRLQDQTLDEFNSGALDRDPMMVEETNNDDTSGRLGGSGRGL